MNQTHPVFAVRGPVKANAALHTVTGFGYVAGQNITVANYISYDDSASALNWAVLLPLGWKLVDTDAYGSSTSPPAGSTEVLQWNWTSAPSSPVRFSYTLTAPIFASGPQEIVAIAGVEGASNVRMLATPDPLVLEEITTHSADINRDLKLSLIELTRVIELFSTRDGTVRSGCYAVAMSASEDGFVVDPARSASAPAGLSRYHSADQNRDGKIDLSELTRVIELYNYRSGTTRTGQYKPQSGTEDGFAPGP
jgi:hypothetical protein